jgi:TRAP-type C4-dicarboxylate transport system substrate-binding protein
MSATTRRTLLCAAGAATVAAALPLRAQSTTTLKLHTFFPVNSRVWTHMVRPWMAQIEKASDGQLRIECTPAMQLGGTPAQLYDQVLAGTADIVLTFPGYTPGRFPSTEVFELPFMMTNAEATSRAYWEFMQTSAPQDFKDVQVLALHVHGPGVIHTIDKPITRVEDLQGLKIRSPTRQVNRLLTFLGATAVNMPLPGIPGALTNGSINGCVVPWEIVPSVRVQELAKYHTEFAPAGGSLYTSTFVTAMNKAKYNSLPTDLRKIINTYSGADTSAWLGKTQQQMDATGRNTTLQHGNRVTTLNASEAQKFRRMTRLVEVEWTEQMNQSGANGYKLLDMARSLTARYTKDIRA